MNLNIIYITIAKNKSYKLNKYEKNKRTIWQT